jgi:hypothetical protein
MTTSTSSNRATTRANGTARRLAVCCAAGLLTVIGAADHHPATAAPPSSPAGGACAGGACPAIVCAADYLDLPVDHLLTELGEDARSSGGTPSDVLLARIDAVAAIRLAVVGRTDGPMQVAAMRFLQDEHDRVHVAVVGAAGEPALATC